MFRNYYQTLKSHSPYHLKVHGKFSLGKLGPSILLLLILTTSLACKERADHNEHTVYTIRDEHVDKVQIDRIELLKERLVKPSDSVIMVVSHRGDWRNAPENSLQAIQNCIRMGVDMVEIDVRPTKDGHLILMHDAKIDRTTTGKGKVSDWTLDSLKTLYLRNGANHPTHHRIPTLEEAMLTAKGNILVNLDKCYENFDKAYEVLQRTGTLDHVVMKGKVTLSQVKEEFGSYLDKVHFMPVVDLGTKHAEEVIQEYRIGMNPIAYELVFENLDSPVLDQLGKIRNEGSKIWVNSLWESLNAGHEDDMALQNPDSIYGWYVDRKIEMIQTDRPQFLLEYLRKMGLHD